MFPKYHGSKEKKKHIVFPSHQDAHYCLAVPNHFYMQIYRPSILFALSYKL